jgi:hypothetical protein
VTSRGAAGRCPTLSAAAAAAAAAPTTWRSSAVQRPSLDPNGTGPVVPARRRQRVDFLAPSAAFVSWFADGARTVSPRPPRPSSRSRTRTVPNKDAAVPAGKLTPAAVDSSGSVTRRRRARRPTARSTGAGQSRAANRANRCTTQRAGQRTRAGCVRVRRQQAQRIGRVDARRERARSDVARWDAGGESGSAQEGRRAGRPAARRTVDGSRAGGPRFPGPPRRTKYISVLFDFIAPKIPYSPSLTPGRVAVGQAPFAPGADLLE